MTVAPRPVNAPQRTIHAIATDILTEWPSAQIPSDAKHLLDTLRQMDHVPPGDDATSDAATSVRRFLASAAHFKGQRARQLKEELRAHLPKNR